MNVGIIAVKRNNSFTIFLPLYFRFYFSSFFAKQENQEHKHQLQRGVKISTGDPSDKFRMENAPSVKFLLFLFHCLLRLKNCTLSQFKIHYISVIDQILSIIDLLQISQKYTRRISLKLQGCKKNLLSLIFFSYIFCSENKQETSFKAKKTCLVSLCKKYCFKCAQIIAYDYGASYDFIVPKI